VSMSGPGGGDGEDVPLFTEINVTPLTDIFLVLLIIFMVTATGLSTGSLDVALPKASVPGSVDASQVVTLSLNKTGQFMINQKETADDSLVEEVRLALTKVKDSVVVLAGDKAVPLDRVVFAMETTRKAGAKRFAIAVAREEGAKP
jgi:biopolymer transport protein ExbD